MKKSIYWAALLGGTLPVAVGSCGPKTELAMIHEPVNSVETVKALFPPTPDEIKTQTDHFLAEAKKVIDAIIAIPDTERTFANTAKRLSDLTSRSPIAIKEGAIEVINYLHPDKAMRDTAHETVQKIQDFFVDNVSNNKKLYEAFKAYAEGNAKKEALSDEERYYLDETMKAFKRAGLDLPDEQLEKVKELKKKLQKLTQEFDRNIAQDQSKITVTREELRGLDDSFINQLKRTDDGRYILGVDYPTVFRVFDFCEVESTRRKLYEMFYNRAYPANEKLLKEIIAGRDELAKLLGFESFAALNIDNQMAENPERVEAFITDLNARAQKKMNEELDQFTAVLPPSVALTDDGKIQAWDVAFLKNEYKKKKFAVDEKKIAEYFPMQHTIDQLLDIYRQFLGVEFKELPISGMWHEDVKLVEISSKDGKQKYGYILLDLHPRPNKYSHAAHAGIVPAILLLDGSRTPAFSVVMANFTKPTTERPSLLRRNEVETFFHEFGHALHAMLGATKIGSFAGTRVKTDFVEMPSQMLEEWLWDKEILKKVSRHYKTGEPLPDEMIDNILALKRYDSGSFVVRQSFLATLALNLYKPGAEKEPAAMVQLYNAQLMPRVFYGPHYHVTASFGHLTGYGAKYYGYLWSKVFALDLFDTIKKKGLLNAEIGKRYVDQVIGKGGSIEPNKLLRSFLGREPNNEAFLRDMGLQK